MTIERAPRFAYSRRGECGEEMVVDGESALESWIVHGMGVRIGMHGQGELGLYWDQVGKVE